MKDRARFGSISIKFNLLIPISITILVVFGLTFFYLINDQNNQKKKEMDEKIENFSKLIVMTNVTNLWNYTLDSQSLPIDQNLSQFLMDKEIVSIEIKDAEGKSVSKFEKEIKGNLTTKSLNINRENRKIGSAEIIFSDYNIRKSIESMILQFIITCLVALAIMIPVILLATGIITLPIIKLTKTATGIANGSSDTQASVSGPREVRSLAEAFNSMTSQLKNKTTGLQEMMDKLTDVIMKAKEIIVSLNSSAKEIEAASQEQTSASNEHASGITEVSATLQELTITAKQITSNVGELVYSSEETVKLLKESEKQLLETVSQLDDVGAISKNNATQINELGKRSVIINEMVELIKEVANKTNILSINASIEASRSGEAGAGFSVVAAEIRELSKETIESAKKAEVAAKEIKDFLNSIIISSENESGKVLGSGRTVRGVFENVGSVVSKINSNYSFTQKIDVSIKQQENGSIQAAETMRQMAEIARQSAETARQTLSAAKDIVSYGVELEKTVTSAKSAEPV